ncbi:MAG: hypothetical protein HRT72_12105 [Flavobacteriales bacterium]|nr:hypothetical protein [Flavobacteriales bacterium]
MNIVILTSKNKIVFDILNQFSKNNIHIKGIVIEEQPPANNIDFLKAFVRRNTPIFITNIIRKVRGYDTVMITEFSKNYYAFSDDVHIVENFNSSKSEEVLKTLNPDLIILAGSRIISSNIIDIPTIGILNAHPGILPKYRGVNVMLWSIYNNDPIGVTIHFIDKGIDTGPICKQKEIPISKGDTISILRDKGNYVSGQLMAEVVKSYIEKRETTLIENKEEAGKQLYKMDRKAHLATIKKLENW